VQEAAKGSKTIVGRPRDYQRWEAMTTSRLEGARETMDFWILEEEPHPENISQSKEGETKSSFLSPPTHYC
jgi:hypothetical protein